jgi:hypothetical protein
MRLKNTQFWCVAMVMALFLRVCLAQNQGQGQGQPQPAFNGTVVSAAANGRSFVIVDKNGAMATIEVTPATTYLLNKANASFVEVARFGMNVRGTLAPDGSVAQVTGRGIAAQMNVSQMQAFLGVNDEEWAILKPRIERVQSLRRIAESRATSIDNGGGNNNGIAEEPEQGLLRPGNDQREIQGEPSHPPRYPSQGSGRTRQGAPGFGRAHYDAAGSVACNYGNSRMTSRFILTPSSMPNVRRH